jgi:hypothetical protein
MSNKSITIPAIPSNWIAHSGIRPAGNGYVTRCIVLHDVGGYHPFCVHEAGVYDGKWEYQRGDYFKDEKAALNRFNERKAAF